jgi:hypothetical protein
MVRVKWVDYRETRVSKGDICATPSANVRFLGFNFAIHLPPIVKAGRACFHNALLVLNKGLTALLGRRKASSSKNR